MKSNLLERSIAIVEVAALISASPVCVPASASPSQVLVGRNSAHGHDADLAILQAGNVREERTEAWHGNILREVELLDPDGPLGRKLRGIVSAVSQAKVVVVDVDRQAGRTMEMIMTRGASGPVKERRERSNSAGRAAAGAARRSDVARSASWRKDGMARPSSVVWVGEADDYKRETLGVKESRAESTKIGLYRRPRD